MIIFDYLGKPTCSSKYFSVNLYLHEFLDITSNDASIKKLNIPLNYLGQHIIYVTFDMLISSLFNGRQYKLYVTCSLMLVKKMYKNKGMLHTRRASGQGCTIWKGCSSCHNLHIYTTAVLIESWLNTFKNNIHIEVELSSQLDYYEIFEYILFHICSIINLKILFMKYKGQF